jgi:hypothetical protein
MNCKGFGRKRSWFNRSTIPEFACRAWRKSQKFLRITGVTVEIRTENIINIRLERYLLTILFGFSCVQLFLRPHGSSCLGHSVPLPPPFLQKYVLWFLTHVNRVLINRFNTSLITLLGWKFIFRTYLWRGNYDFHPNFWNLYLKNYHSLFWDIFVFIKHMFLPPLRLTFVSLPLLYWLLSREWGPRFITPYAMSHP